MPMDCGQLESIGAKNARVVLDTPNVKSAEMCKLFNAGVSGKSKTAKSADPSCYNAHVSRKTGPAVDAAGLFENQIRRDNMTSTKPCDMEARWSEIEHKHNLRCMWSQVIGNRTIIVECMWVPSAGTTIMVTKHYDHPIPKSYSTKKPWPKMVAHYAYFPAGGVTWETMDTALTELKAQVDMTREEAREVHLAQ